MLSASAKADVDDPESAFLGAELTVLEGSHANDDSENVIREYQSDISTLTGAEMELLQDDEFTEFLGMTYLGLCHGDNDFDEFVGTLIDDELEGVDLEYYPKTQEEAELLGWSLKKAFKRIKRAVTPPRKVRRFLHRMKPSRKMRKALKRAGMIALPIVASAIAPGVGSAVGAALAMKLGKRALRNPRMRRVIRGIGHKLIRKRASRALIKKLGRGYNKMFRKVRVMRKHAGLNRASMSRWRRKLKQRQRRIKPGKTLVQARTSSGGKITKIYETPSAVASDAKAKGNTKTITNLALIGLGIKAMM